MGLAKQTVGLMLVGLFVIALLSYAINFAIDNRAKVNLGDDSDFTSTNTNIKANVEVFYGDVNTSNTAFQESTISSQTESSEGGTQFKVTPSTSLTMFKDALLVGYTKIFGGDSGFGVFLTALLSALSFIIGLYAWRAWKGNP